MRDEVIAASASFCGLGRAASRRSAFCRQHRPNTVNPRHADRPEPALGLLKLLSQTPIPSFRQIHVLVGAHEQLALGVLEGGVQSVRRARAALDHDDLMRRPLPEAGRDEQVGAKRLAARQTGSERQAR